MEGRVRQRANLGFNERVALQLQAVGKIREIRWAFAIFRPHYCRGKNIYKQNVAHDGVATGSAEAGAGGELEGDRIKRIRGDHGITQEKNCPLLVISLVLCGKLVDVYRDTRLVAAGEHLRRLDGFSLTGLNRAKKYRTSTVFSPWATPWI